MSDSRLLRSESGTILNNDAVFNEIGPGLGDDQMDHWMYDDIGTGVTDVELSTDLKVAVGLAGDSDQALRVYHPNVNPFGAPDWDHTPFAQNNVAVVDKCYQFNDPVGGSFEGPTLSPDGRSLAYAVGRGIYVAALPDLSNGCAMGTDAGKLVLPGGRHADWGPAGIPPASEYQGNVDDKGVVVPGNKLKLTLKSGRIAKVLRKGLLLSVQTNGPGRVNAKALLGRKLVGQGSAKAGSGRTTKVRVRFSRAGAKALRRKRSAKLTIKVGFVPSGGGAAQSGSVRLTLKR